MAETNIYKLKLGTETYNLPFLPLSGGMMSGNITLGSGNAIIGSGNSIPSKFKDAASINPEVHSLWLGAIGTGSNNTAGTEASGILFDGNTIKMWSPLDNSPLIIDSDNGTEHTLLHSGNITKDHVGLGNVDNTADANKSVKYATTAGSAEKLGTYTPANLISGYVAHHANITVPSAGWYKIASYSATGYQPIGLADFSIYAIGGSTSPFTVEIKCDLSWAWPGSITVSGYNPYGIKARMSRSSDTTFIELYFNSAISEGLYLRVPYSAYTNGHQNNAWTWVSGTLTTASATSFSTEVGGVSGISTTHGFNHTHTIANITDFPTSLPASDVYSWAKASTKPSYNFGEIGAGVATIGDGANRLMFRTNASWASGMYYHTTADEAMVFMNIGKNAAGTTNYTTSWIFAYGNPADRPAWNTLTPAMQIKGDSVVINKLLGSQVGASYNLDVNGSANATTLYQNGTQVSVVGHTHTKSEITNFAHNHGSIHGPDNRSTNNAPSWYMGNVGKASIYTEFCQTGGSNGNYENRVTFTPWADPSGERPVQLAFNNSGMFLRTSKNDDEWNTWNSVSLNGHTHDSRYYTETEVNNLLDNYLPLSGGAMSSGARISASGGNLVLGNSNNAGWVQIQDMCSQSGSDKWKITQAGSANFVGTVSAAGGFYESSDERIKDFGEDIQVDLQKLKNLKKKYFKFKGDDKLNLGVSAQEIQEIYPEIVIEDENGILQVDYAKLSVIALKAIDVLQEDTDKRLKRIETILNL